MLTESKKTSGNFWKVAEISRRRVSQAAVSTASGGEGGRMAEGPLGWVDSALKSPETSSSLARTCCSVLTLR